jgi:hypothetical protein
VRYCWINVQNSFARVLIMQSERTKTGGENRGASEREKSRRRPNDVHKISVFYGGDGAEEPVLSL